MSDWGPRFGDGDKCVRHGEYACPSCLAYALGDTKAQLTEARETLRWVRQTVHQSHHESGEPAQCMEGVCREIAKALEGT